MYYKCILYAIMYGMYALYGVSVLFLYVLCACADCSIIIL